MDISAFDPTQMSAEQLEQLQKVQQTLADMGIDMTSAALMLDLRGVFEENLGLLGDSIIRFMAKQFARVMLFTNRILSIMMPTFMLMMNGVSILIIWVASQRIDSNVLEVGEMTAFITYSMLIIMGFFTKSPDKRLLHTSMN